MSNSLTLMNRFCSLSTLTKRWYPAPVFYDVLPPKEDANFTVLSQIYSYRDNKYIDKKTRYGTDPMVLK